MSKKTGNPQLLLPSRNPPAYGKAVRRGVEKAGRQRLPEVNPERVEGVVESFLRASSPAQRRLLLGNLPLSLSMATVRAVMEQAFTWRTEDPARGVELAREAVEAARALPAPRAHRRLVWDLRAEATAHLANLLRVQGEIGQSHRLWKKVDSARRRGTGDVALEARLMDLKASLRREQGRLSEAIALLEEAGRMYGEVLGDRHLHGRTMAKLAATLFVAGRLGEAIRRNLEAGRLIDLDREPYLRVVVAYNLAGFQAEAGDLETALKVCRRFRADFTREGGPLFRLRAAWLEGLLCTAQGQHKEGIRCLDRVRREFQDWGLLYDAALVCLDLASAYLKARRYHRVRQLARGMYPVFIAQGIPREASACLLLFHQSALAGTLTPAELDGLIYRLHHSLAPKRYPGRRGVFF